jgi:hypothetical protein
VYNSSREEGICLFLSFLLVKSKNHRFVTLLCCYVVVVVVVQKHKLLEGSFFYSFNEDENTLTFSPQSAREVL